jgi:hypothetical protein
VETRPFHGGYFFRSRAAPPRDDGPGVPHAAPGRGGLPADEADDGLGYARLDKGGCVLLGGAADFPNQEDGICVRIRLEQL